MKKMIAIICVLLVIFIGMNIYQRVEIQNKKITADEVAKIEEYIDKIYLWKEITGQALPAFNNINDAPEDWVWENAKKNLEEYELSYEQIEEKAKELFGNSLTKQFPKDGTDYLVYDNQSEKYLATDIELDNEQDSFLINKIQKEKDIYTVDIVEYLKDYSQVTQDEEGNEQGNIGIKNLQEELVTQVASTESETKIIEIIKENSDKFNKKTLTIQKGENDRLYLLKVEE